MHPTNRNNKTNKKNNNSISTNPLVLLLVTALSMLGVGFYTQSYAKLSVTLEQVEAKTFERKNTVEGHFDVLERDFRNLRFQLEEAMEREQLQEERLSPSLADDDGDEDEGPASGGIVAAAMQQPHGYDDDNGNNNDDDNDNNDGRIRNNKTHNNNKANDNKQLESDLFDEMVAAKEKLRIETSKMNELEKYVRSTSFRDATRKYGTGVIRVKLDLDFPEDRTSNNNNNNGGVNNSNNDNGNNNSNNNSGSERSNNDNNTRRNNREGIRRMAASSIESGSSSSSSGPHVLILEMAPLDLMPHSVYTFLEMVHARLFDGCSFILNAMNTIKAAPLPYNGGSASQTVRAFTKVGLDSVSFSEYSEDYPHEQYTVGFAADGSPSFYINTDDNTEQHVGEPCFARIVSGFETVERLMEAPTRNGMWYKKRIGIRKVIIL